jgi:hypothetical protein
LAKLPALIQRMYIYSLNKFQKKIKLKSMKVERYYRFPHD